MTATPPEVVVYRTRFCSYCGRAVRLLVSKGVSFRELYVESDAALRREMQQRSGRNSVPQIFIGEVHVGGCDDLYAFERAGKLDALLERVKE